MNDQFNEYTTVIKHAGIFDPPHQCFKILGPDARGFLNRVLTNNIRDLKVGFGLYNCLCDKKGKILADLHCYAAGDTFVITCDKNLTSKIRDILKRYIIVEDVQLEEPLAWSGAGVIGPKAESLLEKSSLKIPTEELQFMEMICQGQLLSIIRKKRWGFNGFEIWGDEKTLFSLKKEWPEPISKETQEILRIESKTPLYGVDMTEETIPQEADLYNTLDFNKGCYIGQETIARLEHRGHVNKKLVLLKLSGNRLPDRGMKVLTKEGEDAGYIASFCYSPKYSSVVALAYIRYSYLSLKEFMVEDQEAISI